MFSSRLNHLWSYKVFTTLPCYSSMTISLFMSIWDTGKHALAYFISFHSHVEVRISFPGWKWQHVAELTEMAGLFALFSPGVVNIYCTGAQFFFFFCLFDKHVSGKIQIRSHSLRTRHLASRVCSFLCLYQWAELKSVELCSLLILSGAAAGSSSSPHDLPLNARAQVSFSENKTNSQKWRREVESVAMIFKWTLMQLNSIRFH